MENVQSVLKSRKKEMDKEIESMVRKNPGMTLFGSSIDIGKVESMDDELKSKQVLEREDFNVKLAKAKAGGMKEDDYLILRDRLDKGNVTYGELSIKEKNIIKMTDPQLAGITEEESKSLLSKANKKLGPVYRSVLVKQQVKGMWRMCRVY